MIHSSRLLIYKPYLRLASRIILAIVGSYGIATLTALAFLGLPIDRVSAIYWGQIASVIICAAIIILIFSVQRLWLAWAIIAAIASILGLFCYLTI
ncbi:DUF3649 domain-containing protein [Psychrobacter pygoscelis]|uniref:DUF3649 domain-containing protein n=1 Tax=Psychrobacter pygoscelis TaxID=2488563 RepID=UPI00103E4513|nr:DUF3649 domain-containing protein [Psychrobacter pygoscelis]